MIIKTKDAFARLVFNHSLNVLSLKVEKITNINNKDNPYVLNGLESTRDKHSAVNILLRPSVISSEFYIQLSSDTAHRVFNSKYSRGVRMDDRYIFQRIIKLSNFEDLVINTIK